VSPEDYTRAVFESAHGYTSDAVRYISTREGWDTLLECEQMGVQIRDVRDEYKGSDFRDDETKLMFAYDYANKHILRIWGWNIKPCLYKEMKRLEVGIHNRILITSLLTEDGRNGARVIGATGINTRTGEFFVFKSKATIISTGGAGRLWSFVPELTASSSMGDLNNCGVGLALGWQAGAEFACMEQTMPGRLSGFGYAPYSMANAHNTYHGTPIVDANGKEVPWVDFRGRELTSVAERFLPAEGQRFILGEGIGLGFYKEEYRNNALTPELPRRIEAGEFTLPLFADLSRLPEPERRVIFNMMLTNEGKTRFPIYETMMKAGFNFEKDMLQAPVMPLAGYVHSNFWSAGVNTPANVRGLAGGGFLVDWDLRTSLEGLYAAGGAPLFGGGCHGESHTTGRYAGRKAASYARSAGEPSVGQAQIEKEKARILAPLSQNKDGIGWKEINYAIARIMQDYCGLHKNEITLNSGLRLLEELKRTELASAYASNPHELGRLLECVSLISVGELVMQASLLRRASSVYMDFYRLDYPEKDPDEWHKLLPIRKIDGSIESRELSCNHNLESPNAPTYEENYKRHCGC
jgi:succinate dehydrogenase/fumarate reductase flavoprotein subunit